MVELHAFMGHVELCQRAALEYKVTCQVGQGNGQTGNGERWVSAEHDPYKLGAADGEPFVGVELGFQSGQGPSLQATLLNLEKENAKRMVRFLAQRGGDEVLAAERARRARVKRARSQ